MAHRPLAAALIASLALMGAAPSTSIAQADEAQTQPSPGVNVDFPGGTLEAYVEALRASSASPINVILRHEAASLPVPSIQLRNVSVGTALEVAIPQRGAWSVANDDGTTTLYSRSIDVIDAHSPPFPAGFRPMPAYVISASERVREPAQRQVAQPARIEIYSVQDTVRNDADVQKLLTAIDTALGLAPGDRAAELKFHPDTALLIVRATPEQLTTIERVIDQLRQSNAMSENERVARSIRLSEMRAELIERRADLQRAEAALHMSIEEHKELKRLLDEQRVSSLQVLEAETSMLLAESDLQAARARYEAAQEKLDTLDEPARRTPTEVRRYELGATTAARRVGTQIFESLDAVSGHIRSVSPNPDNSVSIDADEEGHRVVTILVRAIQHAPHWTSGSPARNAERDPSWTWVRDIWGQEFYDALVP